MLKHSFQSSQTPARVVVMGAGGFIGGAIARRLEAENIPVLRLTRRDVDLLAADAADKLAVLLNPHDVFVATSALAPCKNSLMLRDNMVMAAALVTALAKRPVAHVINISSDAVYSDCDGPLTESSVTAPDSLHGAMHFARETMFRQEIKQPLAILRPTLVYGANDPHNGYGPNRFRRLANKDEPITLFGKGEERRDHVLIDDLAEIAGRVIGLGSTGTLNIATGTVTSFRDIAEQVIALSGHKVILQETQRSGPLPHNGYRPFSPAGTLAAFQNFAYTPLEEGLAQAQQEEFGHGSSSSSRLAS